MSCDICRLCLSKNNLLWIFDRRIENSENMKDVIYITTGVQINMNDTVSQKICNKCCEITVRMFEFRRISLANDRRLKGQEIMSVKKVIKHESTNVMTDGNKKSGGEGESDIKIERQTQIHDNHPSIRHLLKEYPQLKLPKECLHSNIAPFVFMPLEQVENYFKERRLDLNKYVKLALKSTKRKTKITVPETAMALNNSLGNNYKIAQILPSENVKDNTIPPIKIVQIRSSHEVNSTNRNTNEGITNNSSENERRASEKGAFRNKRKFSDSETTWPNENCNKTIINEASKVTIVSPTNSVPSSAYIAYKKFTNVYTCNICHSVENTARDLKRHRYIHLRCQYCKQRFRSLGSKENHIKNKCAIKHAMHSCPYIEIEKIEFNTEIRKKYHNIFFDFHSLENMSNKDNAETSELTLNYIDNSNQDNRQKLNEKNPVIKILTADENLPPSIDKENISDNMPNQDSVLEESVTNSVKEFDKNYDDSYKSVTSRPEKTLVDNTVSIVKPDIRVGGNTVLNREDLPSDLTVLRELLTSKPLHFSVGKNVQTDLPTNESTSVNSDSFTLQQQKKFCTWNDLTPIDINTNVRSNTENLNEQNTYLFNNGQTNNLQSAASSSLSFVPIKIPIRPVVSKDNQQTMSNTTATCGARVTHSQSSHDVTRPKFVLINKKSVDTYQIPTNFLDLSRVANIVPRTPITLNPSLSTVVHSKPVQSSGNSTSVYSVTNQSSVPTTVGNYLPNLTVSSVNSTYVSSVTSPNAHTVCSNLPVSVLGGDMSVVSLVANSIPTSNRSIPNLNNVTIGGIRVKSVSELK